MSVIISGIFCNDGRRMLIGKKKEVFIKDCAEIIRKSQIPICKQRAISEILRSDLAEPHGTGAQQPTQRPQTRQDGGSGRTSSGNAWSRGAPSFASNSNYTGQAFRRRNVVRFRHGGAKEDLPDRRFVVRELLCTQMGFVPTDILAVINLPDRQGYDVSFKLMSDLDRFWANLTRLRDTEGWDKFSFIPISRPDTASVTIVFWNEAVPSQDIVIWLRRHCDLMSDLSKNRDEDGVWTGGWRVLVKLRQQNNITQHLPNSFFIGREKGICFYAGQPRRCFKCGKAGHVASVCSMVKCSLCNEMGHVSATCQNIRCNLCDTRTVAEPHGTGAQQPTQRPQTRQDGGSGRTSSGNAWSRGAPSFASNSNYTGQAFRRRNVVRFRHGGAKEDLPDRRFVVRELLCTQMGFVPTDILAVINLPDRQGYDVSFKLMSDLDRFWANLTRLRDTEGWDKFSFIPISRPDTASVTIVFWNEAVPPQDIVIWLRRHCDLMSDLTKNRDEDGVWTGGWRVLVKLRQQNNITQHLPNSFFIGREKGICFYAGQPRRCFKCGKAGHVASVCSMVKCSLCNEMGHVSATCQNIRCNLCGYNIEEDHLHLQQNQNLAQIFRSTILRKITLNKETTSTKTTSKKKTISKETMSKRKTTSKKIISKRKTTSKNIKSKKKATYKKKTTYKKVTFIYSKMSRTDF
ncbi:uncharacterized protein RB166_006272 [Leptodactylus fuscus]